MKLIVANGPRGSGKDTSIDFLKEWIEKYTTKNVIELSFKDVLYKAVAERYNLNYETVKQMNEDHDVKLERTPIFGGKSVVEALIYESEEVIRVEHGTNGVAMMAVRNLINEHRSFQDDTIILNRDGGFLTEIEHACKGLGIKRKDLLILRLEKDGCNFNGDSRDYLPYPSWIIQNNTTIEDLHEKLIRAVSPFVIT